MKLLPPSEAAPMIACLLAMQHCATVAEVREAKAVAARERCRFSDAMEIVRRSRR